MALFWALVLDAKLFIFDEPTTALTKEIDTLFENHRGIKTKEYYPIFVSHKLNEVFIADIIAVLRDEKIAISLQ